MSCTTSRIFTLTGCISIQNEDDRNFFLRKVRHAYPGAFRHLGNQAALENVVTRQEQDIVLVGHGRPGMLFTANGDEIGGPDDVIDWRSDLSALRGIRTLRLVGCCTGAGREGAVLLKTLARVIHATVVAPTGYVYFGCPEARADVGLYLEAGTAWQTATPHDS